MTLVLTTQLSPQLRGADGVSVMHLCSGWAREHVSQGQAPFLQIAERPTSLCLRFPDLLKTF